MLDRIDAQLFAVVAAFYVILAFDGYVAPKRDLRLNTVKRIALLGATGSIGRQALEIIDAHPELELVAAASGSQPIDGLAPLTQVGGDLDRAARARRAGRRAQRGRRLRRPPRDALGARARRRPRAREQGEPRRRRRARARGAGAGRRRLLPVDSEHSAAFQCLEGRARDQVDSLVLTASGGPFRGRTRDELEDVTPEEALAHPTWSMGPKITIDSATLANKGLELIEAHFLFGLPYERIEVVVHPTSVVHALVRFRDGAALAHLGYPDMRVPISFALTYPERARDADAAARPRVGPDARVPRARPRDVPAARARARGRRAAAAPTRARSTPRTRSPSRPSSRAGFRFLDIADAVEETLAARRRRAGRATLDELVEADAEGATARRARSAAA